jgi:mono/diheme cytochrome c family protein
MSEPNSPRVLRPRVWVVLAGALLVSISLHAQQPTPAQIAEGDSLFNTHRVGACWACHGHDAKGTDVASKLADNPKWINIDGSLDAIKGIITNGAPHSKKHAGAMPPMGGAQLTPEQIDALAAYVYSLSKH